MSGKNHTYEISQIEGIDIDTSFDFVASEALLRHASVTANCSPTPMLTRSRVRPVRPYCLIALYVMLDT